MIRPLNDPDAWNELFEKFKAQLPGLHNFSSRDFRPYKIEAGQNGRNTRIYLVANASTGISGKIAIDYDRLSPVNILTKFGSVSKIPTLRYFGAPGTILSTSVLLDKINNLLGTNLSMTGDYPDLANSNFTLPAKNASVDISLLTHAGSSVPPFSTRLIGNTSLPMKLANLGQKVSDILITRGINPLKNSSNQLNWKVYPKDLSALSISSDMILRNIDWTDLFGTESLLQSSLVYYTSGGGLSGNNLYSFKPAILALINQRLNSYGLPSITSLRNVLVSTELLASQSMPSANLNYALPGSMGRTMTHTKKILHMDRFCIYSNSYSCTSEY